MDATTVEEAMQSMRNLGLANEKLDNLLTLAPEKLVAIANVIEKSQSCFLDLLRCKLDINPDIAEATLLGINVEEMEDVKRKSLDPTMPVCDVCGPSKNVTYGGVVLEEEDGTFTVVCQNCYDTFTSKPEGCKVVDTWFKKIALSSGIGTDSGYVYEWLNIRGVFEDNVRDFMVRQGNRKKAFYSSDTGKFHSSTWSAYTDYCLGCMGQFPQQSLLCCHQCKKARYCNTLCMEMDKDRHMVGCRAYMESVKTQKPYILPDVCDWCHEVPTDCNLNACSKCNGAHYCTSCMDIDKERHEDECDCCGNTPPAGGIKICSKCKNARYCSKECQKKQWKTHKIECKSEK